MTKPKEVCLGASHTRHIYVSERVSERKVRYLKASLRTDLVIATFFGLTGR